MSRLVILSFIIMLALAIPGPNSALAQQAQKGGGEEQSFKNSSVVALKMIFPISIHNVYKVTESASVRRQFSDSSIKQYKRDISYYMLIKQLSKPDEGFLTLDISIDSIEYKFTEGDAVFEFNSQDDNPGIVSFDDQKMFTVPVGKAFSLTYSPYGEVARIEGEDLDWLRDYINNPKGTIDTAEKFLWLDGISKTRLQYIADVKKIIFPPGIISRDSVWKSPIAFQSDGKNFFDTATVSISSIHDAYVDLEAKFTNVRPMNIPGIYYGIKNQLLDISKAKGNGVLTETLSPKGTLKRSQLVTTVESVVPVHNDYFTQTVTTTTTWDLIKQYQY